MVMKAIKTGSNGPKDVPPTGTHMARLVGITDLGHQPGFEYKNNEIPSAWKLEFTYELSNSRTGDGRPHWISEEVKNNNFEKEGGGVASTLMRRVRSLDPTNESEDGDDLMALLNKPCMVTVSEGKNGYPKLNGQMAVAAIPMGMEVPELENPTFAFDMDDPDMGLWEGFAEFKKRKIKEALNYSETKLSQELSLEDNL